MGVFEFTTLLPHAREDVFAWFERPGALDRLTPGFSGHVVRRPDRGLEPGSTAVIAIGAPGGLGLGLSGLAGTVAGALGLRPGRGPALRWTARHVGLERGRSFTDRMESGPLAAWEHTHLFADAPVGAGTGTRMVDRIEYELPVVGGLPRPLPGWTGHRFEAELRRIFTYRERQLLDELDFHAAHPGPPRTVAIAGASGAVGTQVAALLGGGGHRVLRLVRRPARGRDEVSWDPDRGELDPDALAGCDAVVNVGGSPLGRFTDANKRRMRDSRLRGTALLARTLADLATDGRPRALVNASGIGIYGARPHGAAGDERGGAGAATRPGAGPGGAGPAPDGGAAPAGPVPLTEDAPPGGDFMARLCVEWEAATGPARRAGVRTVNVRTGIGQWPGGAMLQRFLPVFEAGLGGPLGHGLWHSWIALDDIAGVYAHAVLDDAVEGRLNAVAPHPVTSDEYARTLGRVLRRPAAVPLPDAAPRALLGAEGARELAEASQRVSSAALEATGYVFRHPTLEGCLRHVLGRQAD